MRAQPKRAALALTAAALLAGEARAGAPSGRYNLQAETVLDTFTGLTWQRSVPAASDYFSASDYCDRLELGGYNDWRLPEALELETLVDVRVDAPGPTVDVAAFPETPAESFWSGTVYQGSGPSGRWLISFSEGDTQVGDVNGADTYRVRCVRKN